MAVLALVVNACQQSSLTCMGTMPYDVARNKILTKVLQVHIAYEQSLGQKQQIISLLSSTNWHLFRPPLLGLLSLRTSCCLKL